MKNFFYKIKYLFFILFFFSHHKINAQDYFLRNISNQENQIVIESNNQRSDSNNSIFYVEGDVFITNKNKDFIAKSNKAIIYKITGKIKLIGNVEIITSDSNKVRAAEIIYSLKEKKFEAISDLNQRVKTTIVINENNINNYSKEK